MKKIPIKLKLQNARLKDPDKAIADWKNAQLQEDKSIKLEFVTCSGNDKAIRIAQCGAGRIDGLYYEISVL